FLGIDFGTQSVKVGLFDNVFNCKSIASSPYETFYPKNGWAEQKPEDWWKALKNALSMCLQKADVSPEYIAGLTACATSSTVMAVDEEGIPLYPSILWMDTRSKLEMDDINKVNHRGLMDCGGQVSAEWYVPKLLWLKRNEPDIYKRSYKIVEQLDWINFKLTGQWVASTCNATCKWNYNSQRNDWDDDFFYGLGINDFRTKLPDAVIPISGYIGHLSHKTATELNLPITLAVYQGGIDAYIAAIGTGALHQGQLAMVMGSSFVYLAISSTSISGQNGLWGPYYGALLPERWVIEGGQLSGASITQWFEREFLNDIDKHVKFQVLMNAVNEIEHGSEGLLVFDGWQGNRNPYNDPLATGIITGLTLKHTRFHIYRAILEAVGYGTRNVLDAISENGQRIERIIVCGGASQNSVWNQIISDICGRTLESLMFSEAGLLGCAIVAQTGAGKFRSILEASDKVKREVKVYNPNTELKELSDEKFRLYKDLYERNRSLFGSLT
ncbi:FGGY carbohydrate kinase domain-containing protein, partial [Acididesulfobacillus acetoxydans]